MTNGKDIFDQALKEGAAKAEFTELASLPIVEYEKIRKARAKQLGIRASVLDHEVGATREKNWQDKNAKLQAQHKNGNGHVPAPDWPDISEVTGDPKRSYRNARAAITALGITCRYDIFHDRMLVGGHTIEQWAGELTDAVIHVLRQVIIDEFGFDPAKDNTNDAATELCLEKQFDPIADYLNNLRWDGTGRIGNWLPTYLGAEDTELNRAIGRRLLMAGVRRVRAPGCKFDHIIVLEGPEGTMKSTSIAVLAGSENFSDQTILTASDKEQQELVRGVWLYELADIVGMRRAEVEKVKAFASRTHDRARPAYGRRRQDLPRRCIFIATTNEDEYLKSATGNRRFWPVQTGTIDIEALRRDRDQLWAEAALAEATGESLALPDSLIEQARAVQDQRREHDPWDDTLASVKGIVYDAEGGDNEERIQTEELLKTHLGITPGQARWDHHQRLKRSMHRLGWVGPERIYFGTRRIRGYRRKPEDGTDLL